MDNILAMWAAQDPPKVRERLSLVDYYLVWRAELPGLHNSEIVRLKNEQAKAIGVSESELLALEQKILRECGQSPLFQKREKESGGGWWSWVAIIAGLVWMGFWLSIARERKKQKGQEC